MPGAQEGGKGPITGAYATFTRCHRDNTGMMETFALFFHNARFAGSRDFDAKRGRGRGDQV